MLSISDFIENFVKNPVLVVDDIINTKRTCITRFMGTVLVTFNEFGVEVTVINDTKYHVQLNNFIDEKITIGIFDRDKDDPIIIDRLKQLFHIDYWNEVIVETSKTEETFVESDDLQESSPHVKINNRNPRVCQYCLSPITNDVPIHIEYGLVSIYGQTCTEIQIFGLDTTKFQTIFIVKDSDIYYNSYDIDSTKYSIINQLEYINKCCGIKFIDIFGNEGFDMLNFNHIINVLKRYQVVNNTVLYDQALKTYELLKE